MKKTVAFCTLGCKVNQYETDAMRGSFEAEGYEVKEFSQEASVYVINTQTLLSLLRRPVSIPQPTIADTRLNRCR